MELLMEVYNPRIESYVETKFAVELHKRIDNDLKSLINEKLDRLLKERDIVAILVDKINSMQLKKD